MNGCYRLSVNSLHCSSVNLNSGKVKSLRLFLGQTFSELVTIIVNDFCGLLNNFGAGGGGRLGPRWLSLLGQSKCGIGIGRGSSRNSTSGAVIIWIFHVYLVRDSTGVIFVPNPL